MQRLKIIGLVAAGVLALCAMSVAPAWAVNLSEFSTETGFTGSSETVTFETVSGKKFTCGKSTMEGTATSKKAGTFSLSEKECKTPESVNCTVSGQSAGTVLFTGEWKFTPEAGELIFAIGSTTKVECGSQTISVKGDIIGMIKSVLTKTKNYELAIAQTKGVQEIEDYENERSEVLSGLLLAAIGAEEFKHAGEEFKAPKLTTTNETEILVPQNVTYEKLSGSTGVTGGQWSCGFNALNQTCNARIANRNVREEFEIERLENFGFSNNSLVTFTSFVEIKNPSMPVCAATLRLPAGQVCEIEFKYIRKPTAPAEFNGGSDVKVTATNGTGSALFVINGK